MLLLSIVFIAILGCLAQTTGLCMVRGVKEMLAGKPLFLVSILFSGTFVWGALLVSSAFSYPINMPSYYPTYITALGGLIFGLGAAFNSGCGVSTISRLARGQLVMLATILGWLVSWFAFSNLFSGSTGESYEVTTFQQLVFLSLVSIPLIAIALRSEQATKKLWFSMLTIGFMGGLVFIYEPHWTPSGLFKSMGLSLWDADNAQWPRIERFMLFAALVLAMIVTALLTKSFQLEMIRLVSLFKHFAAGLFMGVGAVLAGGGNDTQLLVALPALSLAGFVAIGFIVLGIVVGVKVQKWFA
ncbi:YeeE/YedE thiosulfate transporter family protein [Vibrio maritimus]|uniref:YeeE/YedE thiosulfate transporter family protein n=1 Tax=Vibrio maritimus TaxID=990268 RepID=UPI003735F16F